MNPPFGSPWSQQPMFGTVQTGSGFPFNFGSDTFGQAAPLMQIGASMLSSHLATSNGMQQMQFLPSQNAYDQLRAQRAVQNQMQAMQAASASDRRQLEMMMRGGYTAATGQAPGIAQIAQIRAMSSNTAGMVGMATQVLGTQAVDQAFGRTGSAVAMANILQRSGQSMFDPVTGALGMSGRSSGMVANEVFNQLYGRNASIGGMKGVTAGRAAEVAEELNMRGLLGPNVGGMNAAGQRGIIQQLRSSPDMINRLADQSDSIAEIRKSGRQPTREEMATAVTGVRSSLANAQSTGDVLKMSGGGDVLRAGQAQMIGDRVKKMAGAVAAMEEIFGSEGRPNAPMREIVQRLNALTQGGLASMSGGQLESLVRRTQSLSQATGVSVDTISAISGQAAAMADRYNLPRSLVPEATLQAVAFGAGAKNSGGVASNLDVGMSAEELVLAKTQLGMSGAGSSAGADIAGVNRLVAEGVLDINSNTDAGRMARAIKEGNTTFTDGSGKSRSVRMSRGERLAMLEAAGVDRDTASAVISDTRSNAAYQSQKLNSRLQYEELSTQLSPIAAQAIKDQAKGLGIDAAATGDALMKNLRGMSSDKINGSVEDFSKASQDVVAQTLRDSMRKQGMSDAEIDKRLTPDIVRNISLQMTGNTNNSLRANGSMYKSLQNVLQLHSTAALDAGDRVTNEADADATLRSALGGLAKGSPLERIGEALKGMKPGEGMGKLLSSALNMVPKDQAASMDKPTAAAMEMLQVLADSENNPIDASDAESRLKLKSAAAANIKMLLEGGTGPFEGLGDSADTAEKNAAAAGKRGDKKSEEAWKKRAASLRSVSSTADKVASGELKPKTYGDEKTFDLSKVADMGEQLKWAAVEGVERIPALRGAIATAGSVGDAFKRGFTGAGASKAEKDKESKGGKAGPGDTRISGRISIEGLTKGLLTAILEGDDDSPEHGGT